MTKAATAPPPAVVQTEVSQELLEKVRQMAEGRGGAVTDGEIRQLEAIGVRHLLAGLGRQATLEEESIARNARLRAWHSLPTEERTQRIASERWPAEPGTRLFEVGLEVPAGEKNWPPSGHPPMRINAHSEHEARAFYTELCGILRTEWDIVARPVTGPEPAPPAEAPAAGGDRPSEAEVEAGLRLSEQLQASTQGGKAGRKER
jgi:hypothetical protein